MSKFRMGLLSAFRNPKKSILLLMVSFILGIFIVSSFYVFQTTALIEKTVKSKLSPVVLIKETGEGLGSSEFTGDSFVMNYSNEERDEFYDVLESFRLDTRVKAGENYYRVNMSGKITTSDDVRSGWYLLGIQNTSDIVDREIGDTEKLIGRYFTAEEIEEGKNVIIIFEDPRGILSPVAKLGDVLAYTHYNKDGNDSFSMDFEVIGIFNMIKHTQMNGTIAEEYLNPTTFTYHDNNSIGLICNYAYIPYNTLVNIGKMLEEQEKDRYENLPDDYEGNYNRDERIGKIDYIDSYFKLNTVDDLENFVNDLENALKDYPDLSITSSLDSYLDVKDAVNNLEKLSMIVMIISTLSSFIVLSLIIYVYIRNRKKEVGLYIALGENKKNIILQLTLEVLIICLLGFVLSFSIGKVFSQKITNDLIQTEEMFEEYNQEELMDIVEGNSMNQYMIGIIGLETMIIILSSCYPLMKVMKLKPKDILQ